MSFGIGLVIVILVLAAILLGRAGSGVFAALFLLVAAGLFVTTPAGQGVPEQILQFLQSVDGSTQAGGSDQG